MIPELVLINDESTINLVESTFKLTQDKRMTKRPHPPGREKSAGVSPVLADEEELLDARAAAQLRGVKPQTLYAYTSRGLLRSLPAAAGRARRYLRTEVVRLQRRA